MTAGEVCRMCLDTSGLEITGFASQFASENQPVANQINIRVIIIYESTLYILMYQVMMS